ncbi:UNVERIFIED_CONTAM: hypothetical protein GTU68_026398 [Idotea baltica]|nr:hypothetical protein [Idotea baltica]
MLYSDKVSKILVILKNSLIKKKNHSVFFFSVYNLKILQFLKQNHFLHSVHLANDTIIVEHRYLRGVSSIECLKRISKGSRRSYKKVRDLKALIPGVGYYALSTSKGIFNHYDAIKNKIGGEILFYVI